MKTLKTAIKDYEAKHYKLDSFLKRAFEDGWLSWDNSSEYDIWNEGRKAREDAENRR